MLKSKSAKLLFTGALAALLGSALTIVAVQPVSAQRQIVGPYEEARKTLNFEVDLVSGVSPAVSIEISRFCEVSTGVAITETYSRSVSFITHVDDTPQDGSDDDSNFACESYLFVDVPGMRDCTIAVYNLDDNVARDISVQNVSGSTERQVELRGSGTANYSNGTGQISAYDTDGNIINHASNLRTLRVKVSGCRLPTNPPDKSFYVLNPDPSREILVDYGTRGSCAPENENRSSFGRDTIGTNSLYRTTLDTNCIWEISFADAQNACVVAALVYDSNDLAPSDTVLSVSGSGSRAVNNTVSIGATAAGDKLLLASGQEPHLITFVVTRNCDSVSLIRLSVIPPNDFKAQKINLELKPTLNTSVCETFKVSVSGEEPASVWVPFSPREVVRICGYAAEAPDISGVLQLVQNQTATKTLTRNGDNFQVSFSYDVKRIPIRVVTVFPDSAIFTTEEQLRFRLTSPGNCANLFGVFGLGFAGVGALRDVQAYPGSTQVIGPEAQDPGTEQLGTFTVPPSVTSINGEQLPCTIRVFSETLPPACSVVGDRTQTQTGSNSLEAFVFTFIYSCDGEVGDPRDPTLPPTPGGPDLTDEDLINPRTVSLPRGWVMTAFGGNTGTTPQQFLDSIDNKAKNVWSWNPTSQGWSGYIDGVRNNLKTLTRGETIFMYVPQPANVRIDPGNLLSPVSFGGTLSLTPGYNVVTYGGNQTVSARSVLGSNSNVLVAYRWDNARQRWLIYNPSGDSDFSTVRPGDSFFIYNGAETNISIRWT